MVTHYELTPQDRTQLDGRWHGQSAPLCGTGDGHYFGVHPDRWHGHPPPVTCPGCVARAHFVAPRERNRVVWQAK